MPFIFTPNSEAKLKDVHPDLIKVVRKALELTSIDFSVVYGLRTYEEQKALVTAGRSRTMNSRHLTGHAVDLRPVCKFDIDSLSARPYFTGVAIAMKEAARKLDIPLEWGGECFKDFIDRYHYQLPWKAYPLK